MQRDAQLDGEFSRVDERERSRGLANDLRELSRRGFGDGFNVLARQPPTGPARRRETVPVRTRTACARAGWTRAMWRSAFSLRLLVYVLRSSRLAPLISESGRLRDAHYLKALAGQIEAPVRRHCASPGRSAAGRLPSWQCTRPARARRMCRCPERSGEVSRRFRKGSFDALVSKPCLWADPAPSTLASDHRCFDVRGARLTLPAHMAAAFTISNPTRQATSRKTLTLDRIPPLAFHPCVLS
jgi:hypothetical protein